VAFAVAAAPGRVEAGDGAARIPFAHRRMSGHRITVCRRDGLTPGGARRFDVEGVVVAVVRIEDEVYAIGDRCSHKGVSLAEGGVDEVERLLGC
jgi:nitrite reductase/ring-hydroxylating ferredoxin subunit